MSTVGEREAEPAAVVADLQRMVGPKWVLSGEQIGDYTHDATFMEGMPLAVVRPESTDEVAAVARYCHERGLPITTRGAGTSLVGGSVPLMGGVVLTTERINHIEVDVADTCVVAGTGAITGDIQEAAISHGLMYPPDPASHKLSSIGGNVACNSGGMCCVKYGVTADYVIGMTVVLASGQILKLGGKLRKRASGYRLMQLFIGSEGTLGIVTEVILKLIPNPRFRATALVGFASLEQAASSVSRALAAGHFPAALEIVDHNFLEMAGQLLPAGFAEGSRIKAALIVEQDGNDEEHVMQDLLQMVELLDGVDNRIAQSQAERDRLWRARRGFGEILMGMPKNYFAEDVAVPIGAIPEMVRRAEALAAETGLKIVTVGHIGDGNLHPTIMFEDSQRHLVGPAAARLFRAAIELGGSISAEHGLGALKRDFAELEHGPLALGLMRQVKQVFDPKGILNPGKVFPTSPADDLFLERQPGWGTKLPSGRDRGELGA